MKMIQTVGINLTNSDQLQLSTLVNQMVAIYENSVCPYDDQNCTNPTWALDPDLSNILASSRDYDLLEYVWTVWRNNSAKILPIYPQFVDLSNKGARQGQ
jgi:peptidyl-dipeptidase A